MIVDCHAHLLPPVRMAKLIRWMRRFSPDHPVPETVALETLLEEYAGAGVGRIWNFAHAIFPEETGPLNEWNRRLAAAHPQIVPFGTCHPLGPDPLAVIDRCLGEHGFPGIKFHPFVQKFTPWDERHFPVYGRIAEHRGIAVFHTGFEAAYGEALPLGGFEPILRAFPDLVVVFAHANYPRIAEAFDLVARYPGVYLDTVHVFGSVAHEWNMGGDPAAVAEALRAGIRAFPDRVMFGTDHPSGTGTLADMYRDLRAFGLAPDVERRLLGETARGLARRTARAGSAP